MLFSFQCFYDKRFNLFFCTLPIALQCLFEPQDGRSVKTQFEADCHASNYISHGFARHSIWYTENTEVPTQLMALRKDLDTERGGIQTMGLKPPPDGRWPPPWTKLPVTFLSSMYLLLCFRQHTQVHLPCRLCGHSTSHRCDSAAPWPHLRSAFA